MRELYEGHRQRLRERFLRTGVDGFADYEVLELLLTFAIPRRDVKPLAKQLLAEFGSLQAVLDASGNDLLDFPGLGENSVTMLLFIRQLCSRYLEEKFRPEDMVLENPKQMLDYLRMKLGGGKKETMMVLFLDARQHVISTEQIRGTVNRADIYLREIVEKAVLCRACGIVIAHNHPSGTCRPTAEDLQLTAALQQALSPLGIALFEHFILTANAWCGTLKHP